MSKVCLVTGGAGFIGTAIGAELTEHFDRVIAIDSLHPQVHPSGKQLLTMCQGVELLVGDILQETTWQSVLEDISPHSVIHLAAETGTGQSLTESNRHALVNVCGTTTMLDAFVRHNKIPKRIVLASSRAVYGEGGWRQLQTKRTLFPGQRSREMLQAGVWDFPGMEPLPHCAASTATYPTSIYGATKLAQEHILSAWSLSFGVDLNILRLQNVYGPGQSLANPYTGIVSMFAQKARVGKEIPIYEDGKITRDFVYIDDVARAVVKAASHGTKLISPCDIGLGVSMSLLDLASLIAEHYRAPAPKVTGEFRHGDIRHASCNTDQAAIQLDWHPQWDVEHGVLELCKWIEQQEKRVR